MISQSQVRGVQVKLVYMHMHSLLCHFCIYLILDTEICVVNILSRWEVRNEA
jgi:hypothetical protein